MSPKYSTGDDSNDSNTSQWRSDTRHVMAEWSTKPFADIRHRHETVEHRLVVEYTHGVGVDIRHEVRSDDTEKFPDEWMAVETIESREYGARYDRHPKMRYLR
ncbi:MAG: hypothetical protein ABEI57_05690 [Halapricum sp.]